MGASGICSLLVLTLVNAPLPIRPAPNHGSVVRANAAEPGDEPGSFRLDPKPAPRLPPPPKAPSPEPPSPSVDSPSMTEAPPAAGKPLNVPALVTLGAGVLFGVLGGVFAARTVSAIDDIPRVPSNRALTASFEQDLEDAQRAALLNGMGTSILLSASAAALITGTVLLLSPE